MIQNAQYLLVRFSQAISGDGVDIPRTGNDVGTAFQNAMQVVFAIMGAISVLVITIAAFQYVTSSGDPQKTAKAKDTIMYAVIGLAIAVLATAIIQFVVSEATE